MIKYNNKLYCSGDVVKARIGQKELIGVINIKENRFYICHNVASIQGEDCGYKYGMEYSYTFEKRRGNHLTDGVILIDVIGRCKSDFKVGIEIIDLLSAFDIPNYLFLDIVFKNYNQFEVSDKRGMIKVKNTISNKKTDIKFGRFINTISKEMAAKELFKELDVKQIEKIYNTYLMYQSNDHISVEEVFGNDILNVYNSNNYSINSYTLGSSCMNNQTDYLKLYTNNPDKVKALVIKKFNKISGRCLIWTTDCGDQVMDKRYVCDDWVYEKFDSIRKERKMIDFTNAKSKHKITMNVVSLEKYPYLDTFKFLTDNRLTLFKKFSDFLNKKVFKKIKILNKIEIKPLPKATKKTLTINRPIKSESMYLRSTQGSYEIYQISESI